MKDTSYHRKKQNILEMLLFIVAFSIPISLAFNSISLAVLFLYSFLFFNDNRFLSSFKHKEIFIYYLLFFGFQVISLSYTDNFTLGIEIIKQNIVFLILPITFINLTNQINQRGLKVAFFGLLFSTLLTVLFSFGNLINKAITTDVVLSEFFRESFLKNGLYNIHAPYLAMLLVFTLIATSYSSLHNNSKQNALYKSIIIGILTVSLVLLTGMMSLSILCLFVFVLFLNSKISIIYKGVLLFIVPMIIYFSFNYIKNFDTINHVRGSEHVVYRVQKILNSKDTVRISNWKSVSKVIAANPLLGVGVDGGLEKLQQERNVLSEPYINKHNAHNDYLEILLRYGIIGLVLYLGILYKLFVRYFQNRNTVFLWFILVFMISGLTESYLQRQIGLTFFTFYSLLFYTFKDSK